MNIPNVPTGAFWDPEKKDMSSNWRQFFEQMTKYILVNLGNTGIVASPQSAANIAVIAGAKNSSGSYIAQGGQLVYDTDNNLLKVAILSGGVPTFHTVTTS